MNFIIFIQNKKDHSESIVRRIGLHDELSIGDPVHNNGYRDEYL